MKHGKKEADDGPFLSSVFGKSQEVFFHRREELVLSHE